jgi:dTDP-4-dehydrorhamnose 3,5-epimerase
MMSVTQTSLPGVLVIEPVMHPDDRGFFVETYQAERYRELTGINLSFVQDNHSRSHRGVLRGIHAQKAHPQGKLVRVARGEVYDVVADIDPESDTFGHWVGVTLSDESGRQLWVPPGYGHGFLVTSQVADFEYKCTDYYAPGDEIGVVWNDADLAIDWPIRDPIVSPKDRALPKLSEL